MATVAASADQINYRPERASSAVTFQGWTGGEYGVQDAGQAGGIPNTFTGIASDNQKFTGNNVILYQSGLLGPRPGLKKITIASMVTGTIQGMEQAVPTSGGTGPFFWVMIAGNTYLVDVGAGTRSAAYTGAGTPITPIGAPIPHGGSYGIGEIINVTPLGLYQLDHNGLTVNTFTAIPAGNCMGFYKTRFVANDNAASTGAQRMYFSDPFPGWGSWSTTNYYDIGSAYPNTIMQPFRDGLLIGKSGGEMWYLTGVLGTSVNLRQLSRAGAPFAEAWGTVLDDNICWYIGYSKPYISSFNGAVHTNYQNLQFTGGVAAPDSGTSPGFRFMSMPWLNTDSFVVLSGQSGAGAANRMLNWDNGIPTYHTFGVNVQAWGCSMAQNLPTGLGTARYIVLGDGPTGSYYQYAPGLDRPGFTTDPFCRPGDNSTTPLTAQFSTPEWWDKQGHEVKISEVIVDYRAWSTGSATANGFTVQANMLHRYGTAATTVGSTITATNVPAGTTAGTDQRVVLSAGADWGFGGGFQVTIGAMCGVAIRSITCVLSPDTRRV